VALGALDRQLLARFSIRDCSRVCAIGEISRPSDAPPDEAALAAIEASDMHVEDEALAASFRAVVDRERERGGSVGGAFEVFATGLPPGLGSYVHPDRRLDGRLCGALCAVQAIRAAEIGAGTRVDLPGDRFHDPIYWEAGKGYLRRTNRSGGLEGGVTTGAPLQLRAFMKPIPTMTTPLPTVDIETHEATLARYERSDVCAVPAAAVVGEAVVAWELCAAFLEKFGGDSVADVERALLAYAERIR
jgi:chorismate synthase